VSGRYASDAAAAVGEVNRHYFPDAFTVVAVERRRGEEGSLITPLDHDQLQAQLQNPRYSVPASANDPIRRDQKRITAATVDHSSSSSSSSTPIVSKKRKRQRHMLQSSLDDDDARVLRVVDISNRWHELLHRYYTNNYQGNNNNNNNQSEHRVRSSPDTDVKGKDGSVDEMIAVVVRPDGHVAHIFDLPKYNHHDHHRTSSSDDVKRYMQSQLRAVAQALFLVRAKVP